jgi:hypothetical protein
MTTMARMGSIIWSCISLPVALSRVEQGVDVCRGGKDVTRIEAAAKAPLEGNKLPSDTV